MDGWNFNVVDSWLKIVVAAIPFAHTSFDCTKSTDNFFGLMPTLWEEKMWRN